MKTEIIEAIHIMWFIITFYFTIIRIIINTKLFTISLKNWHEGLNLKGSYFCLLIDWSMWFYQIYFWINYCGIKIT